MFGNDKFIYQVIIPHCKFLHDGKHVDIGDIAWVYGNIGGASIQIIYYDVRKKISDGVSDKSKNEVNEYGRVRR